MDSVLVLIAAPGSRAITPAVAEAVRDATGNTGEWLAPEEALQAPVSAGFDAAALELNDLPVDVNVVCASNRRKRLLVADMDSTMIGQECIDEMGAHASAGERIRAITARAMRGELDFEASLRERLSLLKGLGENVIAEILRDRITLAAGGATLIATMKANGAHTALVSGGFTHFTEHVAQRLGFAEHRANHLIVEDGRLTGVVREPILGQDAKVVALNEIARRLGIATGDAIAVGDGANDIPMLQQAGLGVALHAKPNVRAAASCRIDHGDLTSLLYLQGYRRDEFVLTEEVSAIELIALGGSDPDANPGPRPRSSTDD
jgi:phosphoserine phosphatase